MLKPASLREHLTAAVPQLRRDPEKLVVLIANGGLHSTLTPSLSFEYRYTLRLLLLDYDGHADAVIAPVLIWLRTHQPELLDNPDKRAKALRFDAEHLSATTMDLVLELDLSERVLSRPRAGTPEGLDLIHVPEPPHPGNIEQREHWTLWLKDELLAEWSHDPR